MSSFTLNVAGASLAREIEAHRELQRQNSALEPSMPIARYRESIAAAFSDDAVASRAVATELLDVDPPTLSLQVPAAAPQDDPDSWWNVREPPAGWA